MIIFKSVEKNAYFKNYLFCMSILQIFYVLLRFLSFCRSCISSKWKRFYYLYSYYLYYSCCWCCCCCYCHDLYSYEYLCYCCCFWYYYSYYQDSCCLYCVPVFYCIATLNATDTNNFNELGIAFPNQLRSFVYFFSWKWIRWWTKLFLNRFWNIKAVRGVMSLSDKKWASVCIKG